jgi:hypothetical protein
VETYAKFSRAENCYMAEVEELFTKLVIAAEHAFIED